MKSNFSKLNPCYFEIPDNSTQKLFPFLTKTSATFFTLDFSNFPICRTNLLFHLGVQKVGISLYDTAHTECYKHIESTLSVNIQFNAI